MTTSNGTLGLAMSARFARPNTSISLQSFLQSLPYSEEFIWIPSSCLKLGAIVMSFMPDALLSLGPSGKLRLLEPEIDALDKRVI